jgi:PHD/YefM family antitoxin component YafN of YafNO toxin-antitoxin module
MFAITANDLKVKGIATIEDSLNHQTEAVITVRGKPRYVVTTLEHYDHLRECELEAALQEARDDIAAGRFVQESVEEHVKRVLSMP